MECNSALKRTEVLARPTTWMNPEESMLTNRSQTQRQTPCDPFTCGRSIKTQSNGGCQGCRTGDGDFTANGYAVSISSSGKVLETSDGDSYETL